MLVLDLGLVLLVQVCEAQWEEMGRESKVSLSPALHASLPRVDQLVMTHLGMGVGLAGRSWSWRHWRRPSAQRVSRTPPWAPRSIVTMCGRDEP